MFVSEGARGNTDLVPDFSRSWETHHGIGGAAGNNLGAGRRMVEAVNNAAPAVCAPHPTAPAGRRILCEVAMREPHSGATRRPNEGVRSQSDRPEKTFVAAQGRNQAAPAVCARHRTAPAGLRRLKLGRDQMAPSRSVASTHHGIGGAAGNNIGAGRRMVEARKGGIRPRQ